MTIRSITAAGEAAAGYAASMADRLSGDCGPRLWRFLCWGVAASLGAVGPAHAQAFQFPRDSIEHFVTAEMARQRIPGMSVAILMGDSVVMARGFGYANLELGVPASDSTVYQSGSIGKQFTAALVLMLADQGRLRLDDPIVRLLPEGRRRWVGVTVRHLLNHTSGIPDYVDHLDLHRDYTEDSLVRVAASLPLAFRPGSRWSYSNTGYVLLGAIVHRVTGAFYGNVLRDSLFRPLGMRSARVISEADLVPNRAAGYRLVEGVVQNQDWVAPSLNTTADGALYLSLRDYERWAVALNHGDRPGRRVLETAWTPGPLSAGGTYPYGAGWSLIPQRGHRHVGHTGAWQGFQTSIQRYPDFHLTVIALANLSGSTPGPMSEAIAGIIVPALAAPHTLPADQVPDTRAGDARPADAPSLINAIAAGSIDTSLTSPSFRRWAVKGWRRELRTEIETVTSWEVVTCDAEEPGAFQYLNESVARTCYLRGTGSEARVLVSIYYSSDGRIAGVESYDF